MSVGSNDDLSHGFIISFGYFGCWLISQTLLYSFLRACRVRPSLACYDSVLYVYRGLYLHFFWVAACGSARRVQVGINHDLP